MKDQEAMLRLIPEKIVQVEPNALGNERGLSGELCWLYQHGDGMTARTGTYYVVIICMPWLFLFSYFINVQVYFEHVLVNVSLRF